MIIVGIAYTVVAVQKLGLKFLSLGQDLKPDLCDKNAMLYQLSFCVKRKVVFRWVHNSQWIIIIIQNSYY